MVITYCCIVHDCNLTVPLAVFTFLLFAATNASGTVKVCQVVFFSLKSHQEQTFNFSL